MCSLEAVKIHKNLNLRNCYFRKIRKYINERAAVTIYKSTILPVIEYADFVYDHNIKYLNKKLQGVQNYGLQIAYNQHILHYAEKKSTESLHRDAKLYRLCHRRRLHLLSYAHRLSKVEEYLDKREIHTRHHEGKLFLISKLNHYKCNQDPNYRAMTAWNSLQVNTRNILTREKFISSVKSQIDNPYVKVL